MKILKKMWANKRLLFIFFFSFFILTFFAGNIVVYDSVWNYSFSYAIAKGEIPFLDFNMIIPGFYNFLMAIGLNLISNNILVFLAEQALLVTISFYFLYKMYDKKAWIYLFAMCLPLFIAFSPTYNFGIFFLATIILYLEKNKRNDYLIGILLGLTIMTKHSIGIFFLIPSFIIYFKDLKRLFKRFVGVMIPWFLFLVYLIITESLYQFLDLCIFGMFDFASNNSDFILIYFILSMILFVINIIYIIRNRNDLVGYYVLSSFSVMIPIFGHYHFYIYLIFISLLVMEKIKLDGRFIRNLSITLSLLLVVLNYFLIVYPYKHSILKINNFEGIYVYDFTEKNFNVADKLYDKYREQGETRFLSSTTVWLNIANEEELDYFSVLNIGNHGYNGSDKLLERVKSKKIKYFIINYNEYLEVKEDGGQFDIKVLEYIMNNGRLIEEVEQYKVYYME